MCQGLSNWQLWAASPLATLLHYEFRMQNSSPPLPWHFCSMSSPCFYVPPPHPLWHSCSAPIPHPHVPLCDIPFLCPSSRTFLFHAPPHPSMAFLFCAPSLAYLFHTLLYNIPVLYTPAFPLCTFGIPMPLCVPSDHLQNPLCISPCPTALLHTPLCASPLHATLQPSSLIHASLHPLHTPLHKFIFKCSPSTIKAVTKYN